MFSGLSPGVYLLQIPNASVSKSWHHAIALGYALGIALKAVKGGYFLVFASQIALIIGYAYVVVVVDSGKYGGYHFSGYLAPADAPAHVFEPIHHFSTKRLSRSRIVDGKFGK